MASSLTADSFFNLSTQHQSNNNYNNKELIFVKLTDSALRAIEEFVKNQNKYGSSNPSIQFLGNEGFLSFPSSGNNGSSQQMEQRFKFSLTDNEETQGSYECLQQTNGGQINVLGPIQYKMRVHAQEDVYESTKRNMAKAAQQQKEKSTREIKPNQTDIGRKVTKKIQPASNNVRTMSSVSQSNGSSNSSSLASSKRPLDIDRNTTSIDVQQSSSHLLSSSQQHQQQQQQQQIPTNNNSHNSFSSLIHHDSSSSYHHHHHHNNALNGVVGGDDLLQRSSSNMGHNSNRNSEQQNRRNPDIMRKPIKERLIHLLALRPFKKPELYDRLDREGIKERDRSVITNVLKTISYVRDNAYVLHRHVWNDVHEDWPFYTEQDRATLKRRKPQNLTPPLSSDGGSSSTSGQSPNSQHNGSPPPLIKRPQTTSSLNNMNMSNDIDKYFEPVTKKQRISHYKKPHESIDSYRYDNRDTSSFMMNPRLRDNDDYFGSNTNSLDDNNSLGLNFTVLTNDGMGNKRISSPMSSNRGQSKSNSSSNNNNNNNNSSNSMERLQRNGSDRTNGTIKSSSSYDNMRMTVDNANSDIDGLRINSSSNGSSKVNFSDYPPITRVEQRRKYKTEFDKDYSEYRQLHTIMEKARKRFANLQDELRKVHPSDEQKYREIQNQIIQEYKENNNNSSFQDKKKRFEYLHEKLSHIKKLVSDFDMELTNANGNVAGGDNGMSYSSQNGGAKTMHTAY